MSTPQAWTLVALVTALAATVALVAWHSLRAEARGREAHGHPDGTVHEHYRGRHRHDHPTRWERWDALVGRLLGDKPRERVK